jgi:hypothetical protein
MMSIEDSIFRRFFSNPIVGFVGTLASVIGLALAIYFYFESRVTRDLRYFVNPARAVVVHVGQTSRLAITLDGAPVKRDVSAAQVAFWNEGHQSIRRENVLRSLVLKTSSATPIIDATIRKRSREVVNIDLDRSRLAAGEVTINWNILEFQDGSVVQLVYLGDVNTAINAQAVIEGQGDIRTDVTNKNYNRILGIVWVSFVIVATAMVLRFGVNMLIGNLKLKLLKVFLLIAVGYIVTLVSIVLVRFFLPEVGPPFGF